MSILKERQYVLGDGLGFVEYVEHMGSDVSVIHDARRSYDKQDEPWRGEPDIKLLRYLARHDHLTPFEGVVAKVSLKVPLFVVQQILRHRTFSFNQVSHRYIDLSEKFEYYVPTEWRRQAIENKQGSEGVISNPYLTAEYKRGIEDAFKTYERFIKGGVAKEQARIVLPHSTYTGLTMAGNLRNWAHFLALRLDSHAQFETRQYAEGVANLLRELFPVSMDALLGEGRGS